MAKTSTSAICIRITRRTTCWSGLKIFSPDQLMAQNQSCNVFVAKKLGAEILEEETAKYHLPWDNEKHIAYSTEHMGVLKYDYATDKQSEHIFPYLV